MELKEEKTNSESIGGEQSVDDIPKKRGRPLKFDHPSRDFGAEKAAKKQAAAVERTAKKAEEKIAKKPRETVKTEKIQDVKNETEGGNFDAEKRGIDPRFPNGKGLETDGKKAAEKIEEAALAAAEADEVKPEEGIAELITAVEKIGGKAKADDWKPEKMLWEIVAAADERVDGKAVEKVGEKAEGKTVKKARGKAKVEKIRDVKSEAESGNFDAEKRGIDPRFAEEKILENNAEKEKSGTPRPTEGNENAATPEKETAIENDIKKKSGMPHLYAPPTEGNGNAVTAEKEAAVENAVNAEKEKDGFGAENAANTEREKGAGISEKAGAKKILFAASEAGPFIRSGGLGDVAASLPKALRKNGNDVRVILPLYLDIDWSLRSKLTYVGSIYVPLSWRRQYCGVFQAKHEDVTYYFIDNEYYFKRNGLYGHFDDAERFAFFSKAVLASMSVTGFYPDIIHANDWQTALVPVFLDVFYRFGEYNNIKTVFTIHNIEFQGKYGLNIGEDIIGIDKNAMRLVEYDKCVNFMKGAIEAANAVTTVSETYSREILDPFYSYGLEGILKQRQYKISGIVNGIDTDFYNPETDKALLKNYNADTLENKDENKRNVLDMLHLPYAEGRPLIGMVTRLTSQKGLDLVSRVAEDILGKDISLIILGKGDWKYETMLKDFENYYPNKIKAVIGFSIDVASKIYGGSDFLLMPSRFEPCGLSQMIAMRYGTVPIVREAGGLKDTVEAYNYVTGKGVGFTFKSYDAYDMLDAINRAIDVYNDKDEFRKVAANGMKCDFSWTESARKYEELYGRI